MKPAIHLLILLFSVSTELLSQHPFVQVISREKGFGRSHISMLMEDHQGIIWAATQLGLLRFDGLHTKVFLQQKGNPNSLSNEFVYYLFEDKQHTIWLATRNGLTAFDPAQNKFTRYQMDSKDEATIPNNRVFSLLPDTDTSFFLICDRSGLASFNINSSRVTRLNPKLQSTADAQYNGDVWVLRAFKTINNKILVSTRHGIYEYDRKRNILIDIIDTHTDYNAIDWKGNYFCSKEGIMWFTGIDRALYKWIPDQMLIRYDQPELTTALTPGRTKIMDYDKDHLLISTLNDYILFDKQNGQMQFLRLREDQRDLLHPDQITHSLETQTGIVMLGSVKGELYIIDPLAQQFKFKQIVDNSIKSPDQTGMCDFYDDLLYGKRYISAFQDSLFYVEDMATGVITAQRALNVSNIANRWFLDTKDRLWLCNSSNVLEIDRTTYATKIYEPETRALNLFEMVEIGPGKMFVGSFQEGLYLFEPDSHVFRKIPEEKGWISTQVFSMKADPDHQAVWIGTVRNGLFRYDISQDSFFHYLYDSRNPHSLGGDWVRDITIDSTGDVWFSTDPIGLSRFDFDAHPDSAFVSFSIEDGLPSNFIAGLGTDHNGRVWMTSINGIAYLDPKTLRVKAFGRNDGLPTTRFVHANLTLSPDGKVMIGTEGGYFYFHPENLKTNLLPPELVIGDVLVFDQSKLKRNERGQVMPLELSYKENYLTIRFSVLNYTESEENQVRYIMEGLDEKWTIRKGISEVSYTKVPPGEYVFRILSANNDGVWNEEETKFSISITPPFWERTWFYLLVGAFLAGVGLAFYNYKLNQSIKQNKLLAEKELIKAESERQLSQLEMKALRAQMNPHFIFNCLNSINRFIVVNDNDTASEYLTKFSRLIRQVLENSRGEKINLMTEIETLKLYIEMESLRFIDKFEYRITIEPGLDPGGYLIQPMLIQPYVENAIWHGLMHRKTKGILNLNFSKKGKSLSVSIEDNGVGRVMAKSIKENQLIQRKSYGMKVTAERMSLLSKTLNEPVEAAVEDLYDSDQHATGTKVNLILPLEPLE